MGCGHMMVICGGIIVDCGSRVCERQIRCLFLRGESGIRFASANWYLDQYRSVTAYIPPSMWEYNGA